MSYTIETSYKHYESNPQSTVNEVGNVAISNYRWGKLRHVTQPWTQL